MSLAFGLSVVTMAYAIGHISGCHLNPAVTVGLAIGGRFPSGQVIPYIAAQVVGAAYGQPRPEAASSLRGYFTAHPQEYYDLRGILAPIGDTERQCNVSALPGNLESAYHEFMAG